MSEKFYERLEILGYKGIDASLEESLRGYGLICKDTGDGYYFCVYGVIVDDEGNYCEFQTGTTNEKEVIELLEESWYDKEGFFLYLDTNEESWKQLPFVCKLHDTITYHGHENIFGIPYREPLTLDILNKGEIV